MTEFYKFILKKKRSLLGVLITHIIFNEKEKSEFSKSVMSFFSRYI